MANSRGAFSAADYATAADIIKEADRRIRQYPEEGMPFAPYFNKVMFVKKGETKYYFRNSSEVEYTGDYGYTGEGDSPNSIKENLTTTSITIKPKVYFSADVSVEALTCDPLPDTLARNLTEARKHVTYKINYEMGNLLLNGALANSNVPEVSDGAGWYNSSDSGANLPHPYAAHAFTTHSVDFIYSGTTTTSLSGHVETTSANMTLNRAHMFAIREHLIHHGFGKGAPLHCVCSFAVSREILDLEPVSAAGTIPDDVYSEWWKKGIVAGQAMGFFIIVNEWVPSPLALIIDPSAKPAEWLVSNPITIEDVSQERNLVMGTGIYYRGGYGILKRGAGYVANFDI